MGAEGETLPLDAFTLAPAAHAINGIPMGRPHGTTPTPRPRPSFSSIARLEMVMADPEEDDDAALPDIAHRWATMRDIVPGNHAKFLFNDRWHPVVIDRCDTT